MKLINLVKKSIAGILFLLFVSPAMAVPPLITSITQIAPYVRDQIISSAPVFTVIQSSVTTLQHDLLLETTTRIAADLVLTNGLAAEVSSRTLGDLALQVQISSIALSTGTFGSLTGNQTFTGISTFSNAGNVFWGNGSHLTGLPSLVVQSTGGPSTFTSTPTHLMFDEASGFVLTGPVANKVKVALGGHYKYITVAGQPTITAVGEDTFSFVSGGGMTITTSSTTKTITLTGTGGGDVYLASTQTFTGLNTFDNQVAILAQAPQLLVGGDAGGFGLFAYGGENDLTSNLVYDPIQDTFVTGIDGNSSYIRQDNRNGIHTNYRIMCATPTPAGQPPYLKDVVDIQNDGLYVQGVTTATYFYGNGSHLTSLNETDPLSLHTGGGTVSGQIRYTYGSTSANWVLTSDGAGYASWQVANGSGSVLVSSVCASATSCVASCGGGLTAFGGSCGNGLTATPMDGALGSASYTCTTGISANLTAKAFCSHAQ